MAGHISFGPFSYDEGTATLWREGDQIRLGSRAVAVLSTLLAADGNVVSRDALLDAAWGSAEIEDGNLAVQVAGLRRALGPREDGSEWIVTVPRVGYRLHQTASASTSGRPSLAILPFLNMSEDTAQEHIADGIVEDLITAFSRFKDFGVVARQSSFVYKNRQFDIRQAARALGVRYLVEGSVRRSGNRARVTAQLIDGMSGEHLWAERLDGKIDDVFDFEDRIVSGIIGLIEPRIRQAEIERARRKPPQNLDAHDLYWRALPILQSAHSGGYHEAVSFLDRAVELEPDFAPILAMAAYGHSKRYSWGHSPPGIDDRSIGHALAMRAMDIDSSDPFVMLAAAINVYRDGEGNRDAAVTYCRRAFELNPNSVVICNTAAWLEWMSGNYDAGLSYRMHALAISPGAPDRFWSLNGMARTLLSARRIDEALVWALRGIEANPDFENSHAVAIACCALLGDWAEAQRSFFGLAAIRPEVTISDMLADCRLPHDRLLHEGLVRFENLTSTGA